MSLSGLTSPPKLGVFTEIWIAVGTPGGDASPMIDTPSYTRY